MKFCSDWTVTRLTKAASTDAPDRHREDIRSLSRADQVGSTVAVRTTIADRPPHRTVRAAFPHTAPALDE